MALKTWAGPIELEKEDKIAGMSIKEGVAGRPVKIKTNDKAITNIVNGGDNMKLYKYVILDRETDIVTTEGWVSGEDREQAMARVPTHDHTLDDIKVFLKEFGSYKPL